VFGTLLHDARKRFKAIWDGKFDPKKQMQEVFAEQLSSTEKALVEDGQPELVPLKKNLEWHRWNDRTKRLIAWAAKQVPHFGAQSKHAAHSESPKAAAVDAFAVGVEPFWQSVALRLRGRPDEVWFEADGMLAISDFKSGRVNDEDGEVTEVVRLQLYLYALMAEELAPGRQVRLSVSGASESDVPWGERERKETRVRLKTMSDAHPRGEASKASLLANPGSQCVGCRVRHRCSRYLEAAPGWWPNAAGHPRPLPWDVWGRLSSVRGTAGGWSLWLRDPVGRNVQIEGIANSRPLGALTPDKDLFLFGLQPAEDVRPHGMPIQPHNFYEAAPGPPWKSAVAPRMYQSR
jgi:hypothetical protein